MEIKINKEDILNYCKEEFNDALTTEIGEWLTNISSDQFSENMLTPLRDYMLSEIKKNKADIKKECKEYVKEYLQDNIDDFIDIDEIIDEAKKEATTILAKNIAESALANLNK